jgi:hypothetical protein
MINKLFVLPTPWTRDYLRSVMSDLPIHIDYDALSVEIGSSTGLIAPDITRTYRAFPGSLGIWYETAVGHSWIILPLVPSPEMCDRREQVGDAWNRKFVPYMVLTGKFNNTSSVKPRLNSISTGLVDRLPELTFHCETVVQDGAGVPAQADFYDDYLKTGLADRQKFIELSTL